MPDLLGGGVSRYIKLEGQEMRISCPSSFIGGMG